MGDATRPAPRVTIALPIYNGARYLPEALKQIAAQTFLDYELMIVDNGSTDGTSELCRARAAEDDRVRYLRYESTIPAADNFWRCVQLARGELFLWWAADDRRSPVAVAAAVGAFDAAPDLVMVHGPIAVDLIREKRELIVANRFTADQPEAWRRVAALCRGLDHNGMLYGLYRRDQLRRVTLRANLGHDFLVCVQMALLGPIGYVDEPIVRYLHVAGPTDNPMYKQRAANLPNLLAWPTNRFKCWLVLGRGWRYLLTMQGMPLATRWRAASAFVRSFAGRFAGHLFTEAMFALAAPAGWLLWPITQPARKLRRHFLGARSQPDRTTVRSSPLAANNQGHE